MKISDIKYLFRRRRGYLIIIRRGEQLKISKLAKNITLVEVENEPIKIVEIED